MPQMRRTAPRQSLLPPLERLTNPRRGRKDGDPASGKAGKAGKDRPPARGQNNQGKGSAESLDAEPLNWSERLRELAQGKPLTKAEAEARREDLIRAYRTFADNADWFISSTNRARQEAIIWSTLQDDELAIMADFALSIGQVNPVVAQAIRGMIRVADLSKVAAILGGRAWLTMQFYAMNGGFALWQPSAPPPPRG